MLKGKVGIVTGGSRGIGAEIVRQLASQGAEIALLYGGNHGCAKEVEEFCKSEYGSRIQSYCCDVADFQKTKETVEAVKNTFGKIDFLVNNAGITRDGLAARMKEEDFEVVLDTNLKGAFYMIRHCLGPFLRNRGGSIVNISSISGMIGNPGQSNYASAKAGMIGLTKSIAKEMASKGIRCNAVAPGFIETEMTKNQQDSQLLSHIPLGRMGKVEEVAEAVLFLLQSSYITGEVLKVDGGLAM